MCHGQHQYLLQIERPRLSRVCNHNAVTTFPPFYGNEEHATCEGQTVIACSSLTCRFVWWFLQPWRKQYNHRGYLRRHFMNNICYHVRREGRLLPTQYKCLSRLKPLSWSAAVLINTQSRKICCAVGLRSGVFRVCWWFRWRKPDSTRNKLFVFARGLPYQFFHTSGRGSSPWDIG